MALKKYSEQVRLYTGTDVPLLAIARAISNDHWPVYKKPWDRYTRPVKVTIIVEEVEEVKKDVYHQ